MKAELVTPPQTVSLTLTEQEAADLREICAWPLTIVYSIRQACITYNQPDKTDTLVNTIIALRRVLEGLNEHK